jgi:mono/diheme cytochrome c family protein
MAVLLSVGLLTALPTPTDLAVAGSLIQTQQADDLEITVEITPGRIGVNTFTAMVTRDGEPLDGARSVELQFTPVTSGLPPSEAQLTALGDGQYSVEGSFFSLPDAYQVQAVVRRADAFDAFANFDFSVGTTAAAAPQFPWHQLTGILLILLSLVFLYALWPFAGSRAGKLVLIGAPALALLVGGVYFFSNNPAPQQDNYLINPIPPNADSVAIGEGLYLQNCLPCHGASGAGDGPVGITLNPPPADLTVHTAPGVHPDGRLYDWITNGLENSVMPAFNSQLSDEERWHLVNYIRTFSPEAEPNAE